MFRIARWRLVAWNVAVFAVILLALGTAAYGVFASRIYSTVDQQLSDQEDHIMQLMPSYGYSPSTLFAANNSLVQPPYWAIITDSRGHINFDSVCQVSALVLGGACPSDQSPNPGDIEDVLSQARPLHPFPGPPFQLQAIHDTHNSTFLHQPWRVLTFAIVVNNSVQGVVQIARTVSGEEASLGEFRNLLIGGGIVALLLAALGSLFLANKALVPIRQAFLRQRQFTADASHELRTPLALIRANAEMLCRHVDRMPNGDGELVGEIIEETDHLNRLVGDLLTLARADADSLHLTTRPVDLRVLVSGVHDDLQHLAESRGIETGVSLNGPVVVQGDEVRLRQLLLILLDNALKYTDAGGRVDVSVAHDENRARLLVTDTGIGIPENDLPHIFERFYRVDQARGHETGGTGLGLAIAKWIVDAHRGVIRAESEPGRGTRMQVELPVSGTKS